MVVSLVMLSRAFQLVVFKNGTSSEPKYQDDDSKLRRVTVRAIARDRCLRELRSGERELSTPVLVTSPDG